MNGTKSTTSDLLTNDRGSLGAKRSECSLHSHVLAEPIPLDEPLRTAKEGEVECDGILGVHCGLLCEVVDVKREAMPACSVLAREQSLDAGQGALATDLLRSVMSPRAERGGLAAADAGHEIIRDAIHGVNDRIAGRLDADLVAVIRADARHELLDNDPALVLGLLLHDAFGPTNRVSRIGLDLLDELCLLLFERLASHVDVLASDISDRPLDGRSSDGGDLGGVLGGSVASHD